MTVFKHTSLLVFIFFIMSSCKKGDSGNNNSATAPTNLNITANVSTDGSGIVSFTATANNAITYVYEFGNGVIQTVPSGMTSYKYTLAGNNTYTVKVTATSSANLSVTKSLQVTVNVIPGTAVLVWSDEFNVDGLPNASKWGYEIGTGSSGWGNNELQYYTSRPENAVVLNGVLRITAIKENYSGSAYTSARLITKDKYDFKYGRIEVRAKIPAGVGTWPAIWMLGNDINTVGWPACGETDIMEHRGSELNKIFGTLHYPGHSGGNANGSTIIIPDASTAFHNYIVDWSANDIKIYVDTQLYHSFTNTAAVPFNHNFFILLNIAMGGNFGGVVDPAFTSATMEIDYVRVYK